MTATSPPAVTQDEKILGIVMHALCLAGFPILGPLIVWLIKKNESSYLDIQGRELPSSLLCFIFIRVALLFAIGEPLWC